MEKPGIGVQVARLEPLIPHRHQTSSQNVAPFPPLNDVVCNSNYQEFNIPQVFPPIKRTVKLRSDVRKVDDSLNPPIRQILESRSAGPIGQSVNEFQERAGPSGQTFDEFCTIS